MNALSNADQPTTGEIQLLDREFELRSLPALRKDLATCGAAIGLADLDLVKFVQAAYEVAVNAVRHGGGSGRTKVWRAGDDAWCRVTDHGTGMPEPRTAHAARPADRLGPGHGLWLVRQLCAEVRVSSGPHGTEVLLRYPLPADR
jgi:serine/threonine-protein kinase RsbW